MLKSALIGWVVCAVGQGYQSSSCSGLGAEGYLLPSHAGWPGCNIQALRSYPASPQKRPVTSNPFFPSLLPLKLCLGIYQSLTCITLTHINPEQETWAPLEVLPFWDMKELCRAASIGFTPSFSSQPDFDPCCGASEERGWARLGVGVTGLWGVSNSYNSYFCEKVEGEGEDTPQPSDQVRKAPDVSPGTQLWSRQELCRSGSGLTLNNSSVKRRWALALAISGVIAKIKGNITSFNPKPVARIPIFPLLCLSHFPLIACNPFTSKKTLEDDDLRLPSSKCIFFCSVSFLSFQLFLIVFPEPVRNLITSLCRTRLCSFFDVTTCFSRSES